MIACFRLVFFTAATVCASLGLISADALAQSLYAPPTGFWVAPVQRPIKLFGPTSPNARWFIAQWGSPDGLGGFHQISSAGGSQVFRAESPSATVTLRTGSQGDYTFSQNGENLPCEPGGPPKEFDLFAQIINGAVAPGLPSADLFPKGKQPSLSAMQSLLLSVDLGVGKGWSTAGANGCSNNAVNAIAALVLRDDAISPPQVLYYQLSLFEFCGSGPQADICRRDKLKRMFWWNGITDHTGGVALRERFGYRDTLASFSTAAPSPGQTTPLALDLKPRLMEMLATAGNGIDADPAHWVITGTYHGQSLFGKAGLETTWSGFALTVGSGRNAPR